MSCLSTVWWRSNSRFNLTVWWIVLKKAEKQISTFLLWWCSKPSQDKAEAANPICVNFISCTCVLWLNKSASKLTKCEVIIDLLKLIPIDGRPAVSRTCKPSWKCRASWPPRESTRTRRPPRRGRKQLGKQFSVSRLRNNRRTTNHLELQPGKRGWRFRKSVSV